MDAETQGQEAPSSAPLPSSAPPPSSVLPHAIALSQLTKRAKIVFDGVLRLVGTDTSATTVAALHERVRVAAGSIDSAHTATLHRLREEVVADRMPQFSPGVVHNTRLSLCYATPDTPPATPEEIAIATTALNDIEAEITRVLVVGVHTPTIECGGPHHIDVRAPTDCQRIPVHSSHVCGLPDTVLREVFRYLPLIDLACARRVCRQFIATAHSASMSAWMVMAQEPRSLDYVRGCLGKRERANPLAPIRKRYPGPPPGELDYLFDATLRISMMIGTGSQHVGRIPLLYTHTMRAPFVTPAILEGLGSGTFQLADPRRPHFIRDASLPLCLLRVTCAEPCLALSYKVLQSSADFAWLQRMAQCALEPAAAYVVSWNDKGKHYITVHQIADGLAELKTAIAITDHSWVRLYPGLIDGALPSMGRFECIFTLSRMVAAICCGCTLRAEQNPYARITNPLPQSTDVIQLGQCDTCQTVAAMRSTAHWMCDNATAEGAGEPFAETYADKLAEEALATAFIECEFTSPSASFITPPADAAGDPLEVDALYRALGC